MPVFSFCMIRLALDLGDLRLHLEDHLRQLFLALLQRVGADVPGVLFPVRPLGVVAPLPGVIVDLGDSAGAWLPAGTLLGLEVRHGRLLGECFLSTGRFPVSQSAVNSLRCPGLHLAGGVGVDVQSRGSRHMADGGGEGLHIHAVGQGGGGEGVPQVVEADVFVVRPFQHGGQLFTDRGRVQREVLLYRGGKHPPGVNAFSILRQHLDHWGRQKHGPDRGAGLGLGDGKFPADPANLLVDPQGAGVPVQVRLLERQQFPPPQPRGELQKQELVTAVLF